MLTTNQSGFIELVGFSDLFGGNVQDLPLLLFHPIADFLLPLIHAGQAG